ncbi:MAG TPA: hypothetical protein VEK07_04810, partial [Polyangiaceae bacterium]|nr:hypothetical protein [Polyangiaceae bacterium]
MRKPPIASFAAVVVTVLAVALPAAAGGAAAFATLGPGESDSQGTGGPTFPDDESAPSEILGEIAVDVRDDATDDDIAR